MNEVLDKEKVTDLKNCAIQAINAMVSEKLKEVGIQLNLLRKMNLTGTKEYEYLLDEVDKWHHANSYVSMMIISYIEDKND